MGTGLEAVAGRVLIVGTRVSALMVYAPFFSSATISPRMKAGFTVVLTALLYPALAPGLPTLSGARAWQVAGSEFVVGLIMGITLQFVFEGVELAGQIVGFQVGHSLANLINPLADVETPILSIFYQAVALLIFLQLDVHHWVLRGLVKSFQYCPPGTVVANPLVAEQIWRAAGGMLIMAVQVAIPTLLATILIDISLGFLGRASPQLPVMFVGISVKSIVAFLVIVGTLRFWPGLLERYFGEALAMSEQLMHLAR
ncbi:MAG TPA: flagellar biosynthetic protein FliR [Terriglobia bacterium]|nr:flagellar biosynthetic protein FliR [Terriglobia bacterium]